MTAGKAHQLVLFTWLQVLDLLTTMAFLAVGVAEANPVVAAAMRSANDPLQGLLVIKLAALVLGCICWQSGRHRLLGRANAAFTALVVWNVAAVFVQLSQS